MCLLLLYVIVVDEELDREQCYGEGRKFGYLDFGIQFVTFYLVIWLKLYKSMDLCCDLLLHIWIRPLNFWAINMLVEAQYQPYQPSTNRTK